VKAEPSATLAVTVTVITPLWVPAFMAAKRPEAPLKVVYVPVAVPKVAETDIWALATIVSSIMANKSNVLKYLFFVEDRKLNCFITKTG